MPRRDPCQDEKDDVKETTKIVDAHHNLKMIEARELLRYENQLREGKALLAKCWQRWGGPSLVLRRRRQGLRDCINFAVQQIEEASRQIPVSKAAVKKAMAEWEEARDDYNDAVDALKHCRQLWPAP